MLILIAPVQQAQTGSSLGKLGHSTYQGVDTPMLSEGKELIGWSGKESKGVGICETWLLIPRPTTHHSKDCGPIILTASSLKVGCYPFPHRVVMRIR